MSFGFGGEEPRPCSPRAYALAAAVLNVTFADAELRAAKAKVPDYTGQWLDSDYYADQTDAYYRAAEALEQALIVDHTDKLALGAKFVPEVQQPAAWLYYSRHEEGAPIIARDRWGANAVARGWVEAPLYTAPANTPRLRELATLAAVLLREHCADVDVVYDGTTCDGTCLADDIESELAND